MDPNDLMILDVIRTGPAWARDKAYNAVHIDDPTCTLCGEEIEDIVHCWTCKAIASHRQENDKELAVVDPKHLPNVVEVGIAQQ